MKKFKLLIAIFAIISLASCTDRKEVKSNDLGKIINNCKGHAVVTAKGFNEGNFKAYQHYLIVRDDSLNCYEYVGACYLVEVGDTLK